MHLSAKRTRGFTLIEVMVALIIIAIGILGIAKLQGLVLSNTGVARMRSLAAIQATSLADAMHANRAFWTVPAAGPIFSNSYNSGTKVNSPGGTLAIGGPTDCQAATCSSTQIASYDVYVWVTSINANLPNAQETVTCVAGAPGPTACRIEIDWTEQMVNVAQQGAQPVAGSTIINPNYILDVVP
jgi:type IV pilus assembly protein PilV